MHLPARPLRERSRKAESAEGGVQSLPPIAHNVPDGIDCEGIAVPTLRAPGIRRRRGDGPTSSTQKATTSSTKPSQTMT
jgi:hypothetical protein